MNFLRKSKKEKNLPPKVPDKQDKLSTPKDPSVAMQQSSTRSAASKSELKALQQKIAFLETDNKRLMAQKQNLQETLSINKEVLKQHGIPLGAPAVSKTNEHTGATLDQINNGGSQDITCSCASGGVAQCEYE